MIRSKHSVRFKILRHEIWNLFPGIESIFQSYGYESVITCGTEAHKQDDPHTAGFAIDLRSKHLRPEHKRSILDDLKTFCGPLYYIFLENMNGPQEHYHVQVRRDIWPTLV